MRARQHHRRAHRFAPCRVIAGILPSERVDDERRPPGAHDTGAVVEPPQGRVREKAVRAVDTQELGRSPFNRGHIPIKNS
jgi:hypothetical protein